MWRRSVPYSLTAAAVATAFLVPGVALAATQPQDICPSGFEARPFTTANYCFQTELPAGAGYDAQGNARCLADTPFGYHVPRELQGGAALPGAPNVFVIGYLKGCSASEADRNVARDEDPEWQAASVEWQERNAGPGDTTIGLAEQGAEAVTEPADVALDTETGDAADVTTSTPVGDGSSQVDEAVGAAADASASLGGAAAATAAAVVGVGGVVAVARVRRNRAFARLMAQRVVGWDGDDGLPPLLHTVVDTGPASERWWRRLRRSKHRIEFPPELTERIRVFDRAAEQARLQQGLDREQEREVLLRQAPPVAPVSMAGGAPAHAWAPDAFAPGGMRAQLDFVERQRAAAGESPMSRAEQAAYREWLNRYYSWWRRAAPHLQHFPERAIDNKAALEFASTAGGTRG